MRIFGISLLALIALPATSLSTAHATGWRQLSRPSPTRMIPTANSTLAPFGYVRFCLDNPRDCAAGGQAVATLSDRDLVGLHAVNDAVNRAIAPRNDDDSDDSWAADVAFGDCEDFALTKRRHLLAAGYSPASLRMAVTRTRSGEGHAVLVVRTSRGDLVLDNRTNAILPWDKTSLTWLKIASADDAGIWYAVGR